MISKPNQFFGNANAQVHINAAGQLVANASTLRHDEGREYDEALIRVMQARLNISELFRRLGLIKPLGGLGTIISLYERVGEMTKASVSMDGFSRAEQDALTFDEIGVPVPIFHKEFFLNNRHLLASRQTPGASIDTENIEAASRVVAEEWESHLVNGLPDLNVGGTYNVYGLATHPNRMSETINNSWATTTGGNIIGNVKSAISKMYDKKFYGPFILIVAKNTWPNLQDDYSDTKGTNTILDRIRAFEEIQDVVAGDFLTDGDFILMNASRETADLAIAQDINYLEWMTQPLASEFKVFTAGVIRVKSDRDGNCGIVHGSE